MTQRPTEEIVDCIMAIPHEEARAIEIKYALDHERAENRELRKQLDGCRKSIRAEIIKDARSARIKTLEAERDSLKAEYEAIKAEVNALKDEIERLKASAALQLESDNATIDSLRGENERLKLYEGKVLEAHQFHADHIAEIVEAAKNGKVCDEAYESLKAERDALRAEIQRLITSKCRCVAEIDIPCDFCLFQQTLNAFNQSQAEVERLKAESLLKESPVIIDTFNELIELRTALRKAGEALVWVSNMKHQIAKPNAMGHIEVTSYPMERDEILPVFEALSDPTIKRVMEEGGND